MQRWMDGAKLERTERQANIWQLFTAAQKPAQMYARIRGCLNGTSQSDEETLIERQQKKREMIRVRIFEPSNRQTKMLLVVDAKKVFSHISQIQRQQPNCTRKTIQTGPGKGNNGAKGEEEEEERLIATAHAEKTPERMRPNTESDEDGEKSESEDNIETQSQ